MTTKNQRMYAKIEAHGNNLLTIFPNATVKDPIKLAKALLRIETKTNRQMTDYCNGLMDAVANDVCATVARRKVEVLLGPPDAVPIVINRDPRGYSLKIDDSYMREHRLQLYRDFGGYGILAPTFTGDR